MQSLGDYGSCATGTELSLLLNRTVQIIVFEYFVVHVLRVHRNRRPIGLLHEVKCAPR